MESKLRTVHIETGMNSLGGPAQVVYLVDGLIKRGHEARLICPVGSGIHQEAASAGLPVHPISFHSELDPRLFFVVRRMLSEWRPDVVHLHSRRGADFWGGIAARCTGARAVVLSRRVDYPVRNRILSNLKYGPLCDKIITVSGAIKDVLVRGGAEEAKIVCVYSAAKASAYDVVPDGRLRKELGLSPESPLVGIVAQLIERKGHRYLFDALPRVTAGFPDAKVLVLGRGPLLSKLERQVKSLGVERNVLFAGFRRDIPDLLPQLNVLVHPATMEGLGVAILQAMAARVPVIATAVGGIPEAVQDEVNGILVPPGDSQAIGKALIHLLANPGVRREMGRAGRRIVEEKFNVDSMVEGTLSVYHEVLGRSARGGCGSSVR